MKGGLLELCGHLRWLNPHKLRLLCPLQFSLWTYFCVERWRKSTGFNYAHFKSNFTYNSYCTSTACTMRLVTCSTLFFPSDATCYVLLCCIKIPVFRIKKMQAKVQNIWGWKRRRPAGLTQSFGTALNCCVQCWHELKQQAEGFIYWGGGARPPLPRGDYVHA